jgi:HPt (histidine-containing phosphotransfer) domain-containing protein
VGQEEMFLSNGFNGFISKPIDVDKLNSCLKKFISNNQDLPPAEKPSVVLSDALTASFLRDAQKATGVLKDLLATSTFDENDLKLYTINAHAMKSALSNIGASELSDIAYALEEAARASDFETIKAQTPHFLDSLSEVVKNLTPSASDADDYDSEFLKALLQEILTACENYNKKAARKALAALNEKPWSSETKAVLQEISTHILHSEFDDVAEVINKFMQS